MTEAAAPYVRLATVDDAAALGAIYRPFVTHTAVSFEEEPPSDAEMRARIAAAGDRYPWLACERDGGVAGYAYAGPHRSRAAYRWSVDVSVYVAEGARGSGIGTALYRALVGVLTAQGYARAFAGIALPNAASVALHRACGFTDVGVYRRSGYKLGRWIDTLWVQRALYGATDAPAEPRGLEALGTNGDVSL